LRGKREDENDREMSINKAKHRENPIYDGDRGILWGKNS
jgi:hypothetical protein